VMVLTRWQECEELVTKRVDDARWHDGHGTPGDHEA
jgi:hypothetical protein